MSHVAVNQLEAWEKESERKKNPWYFPIQWEGQHMLNYPHRSPGGWDYDVPTQLSDW